MMRKRAFCLSAVFLVVLLFMPAARAGTFHASAVGWTEQVSGTTEDLRSVSVVDASTAWAVGANYTILKTTDGSTWNSQTTGAPITNDLYGVDALDSQNAFAVGDTGLVTKTTNGTDWATTSSPT